MDYSQNIVVLIRHDVRLHFEPGTLFLILGLLLVLFFWFGQTTVVFYGIAIVHHTLFAEIAGLVIIIAALFVYLIGTDVHATSTHETIVNVVVGLTMLLWVLDALMLFHMLWLRRLLKGSPRRGGKKDKRSTTLSGSGDPEARISAPMETNSRNAPLPPAAAAVFVTRKEAFRVVALTGVVRRSALLLALLLALWVTILETRRDSLNTTWSFIILGFLVFSSTHVAANLLTFFVLHRKHLPRRYRATLAILAGASILLMIFLICLFA